MSEKHHYRKVFKSDHLASADLEDLQEQGSNLVFTVKEVRQEFEVRVAGKEGNYNIAYFVEPIKPMVLNAGNSKLMRDFNGGSPFVEDWGDTLIRLYVDKNIRFGKELVEGIRISPVQPKKKKRELTPDMKEWQAAITYLKGNGTLDGIKGKYSLSSENEEKLKEDSLDA